MHARDYTHARRPYRTLRCFREKRRKCSWRVDARHFHYSSRRQIQHTRKVVVVIASSLSRHRSLTENEYVRTLVSARNFSRRYSRTNPFINWLFVRWRADWVSYAVVQDPMQCGGGVRWRPEYAFSLLWGTFARDDLTKDLIKVVRARLSACCPHHVTNT